jgi:hypothetical protein
MNNILLCMILIVQLWNFRAGMFELAVLKHAETSMRSEFVVIRRSISELQYELDTLKERFSVK